ncbi:RecQ family ATP-dependent DNA helicase [Kurthia sibirica]|uniref:ATP-dependent DNA helicase n=1 Tax=Kurthia sibirica TaxID=202750 RepID=A0A2U3AR68_9BACL|nr:RecQ family ATP-dependent DNA helicase [Kurthia sibirica]PWI27033.1 ATP-dependent DNA helicase [Kurthia sibirica]GEK35315.1 ATP-dependent DNA helicase RecQ [Kurthia sibirica]
MGRLEQILNDQFGYSSFRAGQKEVIEAVIKGQDVVTLLPTGSGKSLCYQLPAYALAGSVLIISPLLSLMQDQVEQLKLLGEKRVIAINSFLNWQDKKLAFANLSAYRFIFVSPEMLTTENFQHAIADVNLALIAVDEAHCISQWGFDFRPQYLKIGQLFNNASRPPIIALTATATTEVIDDIKKYLSMMEPFEWIAPVDRKNIAYQLVKLAHSAEKITWLENNVQNDNGPGIIYTQSRKRTIEFANLLLGKGIRAAAYHAGMEQEDRQLIQHQFLHDEIQWIVATNAFGMGVHKADIRQVIHDHIPSAVANYMQEVGRAGRDGQQALATVLYCEHDEQYTQNIVLMDYPTPFQIEQYAVFQAANRPVNEMLDEQLIRETTLRILMYWMEELKTTQAVIHQIDALMTNKVAELGHLVTILINNGCIRQQLSDYFGQQLTEKPENCCSICGLQQDIIMKKQQKTTYFEETMSWEQRMHDIFPM